jgi:hypothetical protein
MPQSIDAVASSFKRRVAERLGRETVIPRECYRPGSLREDFERLALPSTPMGDADILSFLLKYFHASIYPGSESHAVPLDEVSSLLGHFFDLWSDEPGVILPLASDHSAFPLRMLTDLPRTAHIFRSVANRPLPPAMVQDPYLGIDLGTGTGIILVAAWFQAKRNGVAETRLFGVEYDDELSARTRETFSALGIGDVITGDARDPAIYTALPDGPVAFVGNENIPAPTARLSSEPFTDIHATLFSAMFRRLKGTVFFPEALIVRDRDTELDVVLSKNNRFQVPSHYRHLRPRPRAIVIEGRLTRLRQIGNNFRKYISESWLKSMPGRW